jgi:hypothetical protein
VDIIYYKEKLVIMLKSYKSSNNGYKHSSDQLVRRNCFCGFVCCVFHELLLRMAV